MHSYLAYQIYINIYQLLYKMMSMIQSTRRKNLTLWIRNVENVQLSALGKSMVSGLTVVGHDALMFLL